jgi:large subunit ribosomal protein L35
MGYKFKPNKSVAKRFKVTKTGKVKRHHSFTSHLRSARNANKRRRLRGPAILFEGHARNMRALIGISGTRPNQIAHERALAAQEAKSEPVAKAAPAAKAAPVAKAAPATKPEKKKVAKK